MRLLFLVPVCRTFYSQRACGFSKGGALFIAISVCRIENLKGQRPCIFIHNDLTMRAYNRNQFFLWGVATLTRIE